MRVRNLFRFFFLIFLLVLAHPAQAGYSMYQAVRLGYLTWSGTASAGFSETQLVINNVADVAIDIDFSTVWFTQDNNTQRIGLAYEKSTGSYYLHLVAGFSGTLTFQSRCLDRNKHAPVTGGAFTKLYSLGSNFSPIIRALRQNYTQQSVWNVTDGGGTFTQSWKEADPRNLNGGLRTIDLSGSLSWKISGSVVNISAGKVTNNQSGGTSGSLRLRLWATNPKYIGGGIHGYVLGIRRLGQLQGGYSYNSIAGNVQYTAPPTGYYYTTLTLEEYTASGWVIRDYADFSGTSYL